MTSFLAAPFLVIFCLTGLFLLFGGEVYDWNTSGEAPKYAAVEEETLYAYLGEAVSRAAEQGETIRSVRFVPSMGRIRVLLADSAAPLAKTARAADFYLRDGALHDVPSAVPYRQEWLNGAMRFLSRLHVRLNDGEAGRILMAAPCALSMVSIGTGFLLYPRFMKGLSFGVRRPFSQRLWWSDWHKALGILAGGWLFVLSFSGLALYLYRQGADAYQASAYQEAAQEFRPSPGAPLDLSAALVQFRHEWPEKRVLAIFPPDEAHPFFAFEVADAAANRALYAARQWAFLSADGEKTLFAPPPAWLAIGALASNLHFRNHSTLALKSLWAFFLLLSLLLTVSGLAVHITRFSKSAGTKPTVTPLFFFGAGGVWALALLPAAGLFLPLYGAEGLGAAAFLIVVVGAACLTDKTWFIKK